MCCDIIKSNAASYDIHRISVEKIKCGHITYFLRVKTKRMIVENEPITRFDRRSRCNCAESHLHYLLILISFLLSELRYIERILCIFCCSSKRSM